MPAHFYFDKYEKRIPLPPLKYSAVQESLFQFFAIINLSLGAWYINWRWTESINYQALWFSIPLLLAETLAYIGLILFTINLWKTRDTPKKTPPHKFSETLNKCHFDRAIKVDVFITTYNEDPELVRLSIKDAKRVRYPYAIEIKIYVLDDGKRPQMAEIAQQERVNYITRDNNIGFKAGNLRHAMELTSGDFIVICDADTRLFPTFLEHTLGYFKDPDVAWVQTPQWFYDIPEGKSLAQYLQDSPLKSFGYYLGKGIEALLGTITIGHDPFANDPKMFYDVILRRRNWANASFCCGAGSIHRRDAIMRVAIKEFARSVDLQVNSLINIIKRIDKETKGAIEVGLNALVSKELIQQQVFQQTELTPYKFHVSEDIYTSIVLHSDTARIWKSVLHPEVESKMLSPLDLKSWVVQRYKYAGGTLDIALRDSHLFEPGLSLMQRLMYASTYWSYLGGIWNIIFLLAPIIFLFTGISPVSAYSGDFFKHILPFLVINEIAMMIGIWGLSGFKSKAAYLAFFSINLRALWTVLNGKVIKFPVTPKNIQKGNFFYLVIPQFTLIILTIASLLYGYISYRIGSFQNLSGLIANLFWGLNNIACLSGFVLSAFYKAEPEAPAVPAEIIKQPQNRNFKKRQYKKKKR